MFNNLKGIERRKAITKIESESGGLVKSPPPPNVYDTLYLLVTEVTAVGRFTDYKEKVISKIGFDH